MARNCCCARCTLDPDTCPGRASCYPDACDWMVAAEDFVPTVVTTTDADATLPSP